jgi:hypothetical protein
MYNSGYDLTTTTSSTDWFNLGQLTAAAAVVVILLALVVLAIVVFLIIAQCKLFSKAGEAWWKALIPVYNSWVETKITGLAWWWFPIYMGVTSLSGIKGLSVLGFGIVLISFNYNYNLAKKFGKSNGFAFLTTILPIIGLPILAFGSAKYDAKAATDKNGIFAVEKDLVK